MRVILYRTTVTIPKALPMRNRKLSFTDYVSSEQVQCAKGNKVSTYEVKWDYFMELLVVSLILFNIFERRDKNLESLLRVGTFQYLIYLPIYYNLLSMYIRLRTKGPGQNGFRSLAKHCQGYPLPLIVSSSALLN